MSLETTAPAAQAPPSTMFWIPFDEAESAVNTLVHVAADEPAERPTCVVLTGRSGMGKTSILREAQRRITEAYPAPVVPTEARHQPMLRMVVPPNPSSTKINLMLLWKQGWVIKPSTRVIADMKVAELVREQKTRLIAIDQIHAILTIGGKAKRDTLDALRFLMTEGNVALVVAGIDRAAEVFAEDEELASRSILVKLDPWPPGERTQRMIRAMARGLGLIHPERLAEPEIASRITEMSGGLTGNVKRLLHWASRIAVQSGRIEVTLPDIESAGKLFPLYRHG